MQALKKISCYIFLTFFTTTICSGYLPAPNKVVIVILENHAYNQIVGSPYAPYINGLVNDSMTALFTQSFGLSHPSQPNYIQFFSGSNQGVIDNLLPLNLPFNTPNLYSELAAVSKTFIAYSQSLPSVGFTGETSGSYARKHAPWVHWQGAVTNGFPPSLHQPFTAFPANYNNLPNVSVIVPDQDHDMHNGTDPSRITTCDTWLQTNLNGYIQWARTNNSLLILTFDEDDNISANRILTFFTGPMVQKGSYSTHIDHYNLLRTIEDIYGTTHAGAAATAATIDYCWKCPQQLTISAGGITNFCAPTTVTLTASAGSSYMWSNGKTTQNIIIDSTGNYNCRITATTGCLSTSNTINVHVDRLPFISTFTDTSSLGEVVTIKGSSFTGASLLKLNGNQVSFTIANDSTITFTVPYGSTSGLLEITDICGSTQSNHPLVIVPGQIHLNLKVLIEGYHKGNGILNAISSISKCDTVRVDLYQIASPYVLMFSAFATIDTFGNGTFNFPENSYNNLWYVAVSGKNFLKTWSSSPLLLLFNTSYDFTTSDTKAYGNNQKNLGSSRYGFFSGDVNQDGNVNFTDVTLVKTRIQQFSSGYSPYDLTGDKFVESADWSLIENNLGKGTVRPN